MNLSLAVMPFPSFPSVRRLFGMLNACYWPKKGPLREWILQGRPARPTPRTRNSSIVLTKFECPESRLSKTLFGLIFPFAILYLHQLNHQIKGLIVSFGIVEVLWFSGLDMPHQDARTIGRQGFQVANIVD